MLKTKVFLSSVTNLSDARYAAGMGVNSIGFNINPENDSFVTPEQVKTISEWVSGVDVIGEVDNLNVGTIKDYTLDNILTNNPDLVEGFEESILKITLDETNLDNFKDILESCATKVSFFVIEVTEEKVKEWQKELSNYCREYPLYLDTNFTDDNLSLVVDEIQPTGIVLYGSNEEKPGLSSYDGIADILEQLELE